MCRSKQTNEVTEGTTSSDEEGILIQTSDSCDNFEIMSIKIDYTLVEQIKGYTENWLENTDSRHPGWKETQNIKKVDIRRNL